MPGDRAAHVEQVATLVELDDLQVLLRLDLDAEVARAPAALGHTLADREVAPVAARPAVRAAVAVALGLPVEAVALDRAGEAAPLGHAGDVDAVDVLEHLHVQLVTLLVRRQGRPADL